MAMARVEDMARTVKLADDLVAAHDKFGAVCLVQCGGPSTLATDLNEHLTRLGRRTMPLVIKDRAQAQSDVSIGKLVGASAVWVFAEDMLETFFTVFATQLAFILRAKARSGFPVAGFGQGALALGGLLLANRLCHDAQYELVSGLGWAPRVLMDAGAHRPAADSAVAQASVLSLPGLLSVDLRTAGGVRVEGPRLESIGSEPVQLMGGGDNDSLLVLELEPGQTTTIAPPPFAPFERGLLPPATVQALTEELRRGTAARLPTQPAANQAPPAQPRIAGIDDSEQHTRPGSARPCPMCKKVHAAEAKLELAA
jgi:hypothetical protein